MHDTPQDDFASVRSTRADFLSRFTHRPRPSLAAALAAGGGAIVWLGVFLVALDVYLDSSEDGWTGALFFVGLAAIAIAVLVFAPKAGRPNSFGETVVSGSATTALVLSVPTTYGFLIFPTADSFGDVRWFIILTIVTWALLFVVSNSRGRPILLGLAAALLYFWIVGEVADTDAYIADPIPSPPIASPAAIMDGMRGDVTVEHAAFSAQEVPIDDLDPSDPLYPLAQRCDEGDLEACDELWISSEADSDFEAFAESCGGDPRETYPCAFVDEDIGGQIEDDLEDPLATQEDKTLEIGLVSLLFGALYLAAVRLLDRSARPALATAFVLTAVGALITAASSLGAETESAIAGGLITVAIGVAIGVVGWFAIDRRFMTWGGGIIASVGALIVAIDVAPEGSATEFEPDLIGPGLVILAFGLAVVLLGWLVYHLLERRGESEGEPPAPTADAQWQPPGSPPSDSTPEPPPEPDPVPI